MLPGGSMGVWGWWICTLAWGEPVRAHIGLLIESEDDPRDVLFVQDWTEALEASGRYHVVDGAWVKSRKPGIQRECGVDVACWQAATHELGLDRLALVERIDGNVLGIRVMDESGVFRRATAMGPASSKEALNSLCLGNGMLQVRGGRHVRVDDRRVGRRAKPWPAGKVSIETPSGFVVALVRPNETTIINLDGR